MRNLAFASGWDYVDPPPPEECGQLIEAHEGVDARLLEAGNHCGATYEEVKAFAGGGARPQAADGHLVRRLEGGAARPRRPPLDRDGKAGVVGGDGRRV